MHFNCVAYTMCEDSSDECGSLPLPSNDACSDSVFLNYPTNSIPQVVINNLSNTSICPIIDYPTDSGIPLPSEWELDSSGDLWYAINVGSSIITQPYITVEGISLNYPQVAVYEGNCSSLAFVGAAGAESEKVSILRPLLDRNTIFYIRITNSGGNINTGSFRITISLDPVI